MISVRRLLLLGVVSPLSCTCGPEPATASASGDGSSDGSAITTGDDSGMSATVTSAGSADGSGTTSAQCEAVIDDEECDPWCQDCPEGSKCTPVYAESGASLWAAKCTPTADEPKAPGETCSIAGDGESAVDNCEQGSMCVAWLETPTCVPLCEGSPETPQCTAPARCFSNEDPVLALCLPSCDPFAAQLGCDVAGYACYAYPNLGPRFPMTEVGTLVCLPDAGNGFDYGLPCEFPNGCDGGFFCAPPELVPGCDPGNVGCCTPFCDASAGDACPDPGVVTCEVLFAPGAAPEGLDHVGACVIGS